MQHYFGKAGGKLQKLVWQVVNTLHCWEIWGNVSFSAAVDASLRLCRWHPKPNVSVVGVSLEPRHCASVPWLPLSTSRGHMGVTQGCGVV